MTRMVKVLKRAMTPLALQHKHTYDTKYEQSPKRIKYREELNRERRKRGIYGHGGPDVSHTSQHTLVLENPHSNRARHFAGKTLKPMRKSPIDYGWNIIKIQQSGSGDGGDSQIAGFGGGPRCPKCGAMMQRMGTKWTCPCGYVKE